MNIAEFSGLLNAGKYKMGIEMLADSKLRTAARDFAAQQNTLSDELIALKTLTMAPLGEKQDHVLRYHNDSSCDLLKARTAKVYMYVNMLKDDLKTGRFEASLRPADSKIRSAWHYVHDGRGDLLKSIGVLKGAMGMLKA